MTRQTKQYVLNLPGESHHTVNITQARKLIADLMRKMSACYSVPVREYKIIPGEMDTRIIQVYKVNYATLIGEWRTIGILTPVQG